MMLGPCIGCVQIHALQYNACQQAFCCWDEMNLLEQDPVELRYHCRSATSPEGMLRPHHAAPILSCSAYKELCDLSIYRASCESLITSQLIMPGNAVQNLSSNHHPQASQPPEIPGAEPPAPCHPLAGGGKPPELINDHVRYCKNTGARPPQHQGLDRGLAPNS